MVVVPKGIEDVEVLQVLAFQVLRAYMVLKESRDFLDIKGYLGDPVHEGMMRYAVTKDYWVKRVSQDHQGVLVCQV